VQKTTFNSGYSPVVTHLTTDPPVTSLSTAERTGSAIFLNLWSNVKTYGCHRVDVVGEIVGE
jgi:hypothetical protein